MKRSHIDSQSVRRNNLISTQSLTAEEESPNIEHTLSDKPRVFQIIENNDLFQKLPEIMHRLLYDCDFETLCMLRLVSQQFRHFSVTCCDSNTLSPLALKAIIKWNTCFATLEDLEKNYQSEKSPIESNIPVPLEQKNNLFFCEATPSYDAILKEMKIENKVKFEFCKQHHMTKFIFDEVPIEEIENPSKLS
ncbi:MAG: hypothetical protein C5B43_02720, partial [Verrucomicrobia bacterium]